MERIRPVTDLRNNLDEISRLVHETNEPVILTENRRADIVIMSMETYENLQFHSEAYLKLKEAESGAAAGGKTYTSKEAFSLLEKTIS